MKRSGPRSVRWTREQITRYAVTRHPVATLEYPFPFPVHQLLPPERRSFTLIAAASMGITGLLPVLKSIQTTRKLSDFAGQTIAVDGYVWLHRGVYNCSVELATGKETHKCVVDPPCAASH